MGIVDQLASKIDDKFLVLASDFNNALSVTFLASYRLLNTESLFSVVRTIEIINNVSADMEVSGILKLNILLYHARNKFVTHFLESYYFPNPNHITAQYVTDVPSHVNRYCDEDDLINFTKYALLVNKICHG